MHAISEAFNTLLDPVVCGNALHQYHVCAKCEARRIRSACFTVLTIATSARLQLTAVSLSQAHEGFLFWPNCVCICERKARPAHKCAVHALRFDDAAAVVAAGRAATGGTRRRP